MKLVIEGDCAVVMPQLKEQGFLFDAIVTDPPYGIDFMGRDWDSFGRAQSYIERGGYSDKGIMHGYGRGGTSEQREKYRRRANANYQEWCESWAHECLQLLKPGGHMLCFGGTRTFHRMACAIEDAGFEIRDCLMWLYGSGFPKSHDVSKAIDKHFGAQRRISGLKIYGEGAVYGMQSAGSTSGGIMGDKTERPPSLDTEPATPEAVQWDGWGTALKPAWEPIILARKPLIGTVAENVLTHGTGGINIDGCRVPINPNVDDPRLGGNGSWGTGKMAKNVYEGGYTGKRTERSQSAEVAGTAWLSRNHKSIEWTDSGSAARFFYCAKASAKDRAGSKHPTVKPVALMQYLVRLVTPPGGLVLDPFAGSGTTLQAALMEGFSVIGIEKEAEYVADIRRRLAA